MNMKRMIATNKKCTCIAMSILGAMAGMAAAKAVVNHCCCAERLKCKAKKAFKTMEDSIMG